MFLTNPAKCGEQVVWVMCVCVCLHATASALPYLPGRCFTQPVNSHHSISGAETGPFTFFLSLFLSSLFASLSSLSPSLSLSSLSFPHLLSLPLSRSLAQI